MKGIIIVVWEKYLTDQFGPDFIETYRKHVGEPPDQLPVSGKVYPDALLVNGLRIANQLTFYSEDRLMFEYGRYFMLNGLVEYLCGYLLAQAWSASDLLLLMRDAHAQMRRTPDGLEPPLFAYDLLAEDKSHLVLTYESGRKLCSLLDGCIHGAADRFGEKAYTREHACMKRGSSACQFEVRFEGESWAKHAAPQVIDQEKQRLYKQDLSNLVLQALSFDSRGSLTLNDVHHTVMQNQGPYFPEIYKHQPKPEGVHVSQVHTVLAKLVQVGLVASTANQPGDTFTNRRYWRAPTHD